MAIARKPAEVFAPGVFVREELEERGWTQADLAEILGRPVGMINELISGKRGVSPETARGLSAAFGTSAELWMNLEASYQLSKVSEDREGEIALKAKIFEKGPIKEMARRSWVSSSSNVRVLERSVLSFYGIESLDDEPKPFPHAAKKATSYDEAPSATQLAWLYRAWHVSRMLDVSQFNAEKLDQAIETIVEFKQHAPEIRHVPRVLADAGVRFVVVQPLAGSKIDGACFWTNEKPTIAMSLRFDRIDNFWFVLMHELGHLKRGEDSIDEDVLAGANEENQSEAETAANTFALECLVPQSRLQGFIARTRPLYSQKKIEAFSQVIGVHPGIVVGQLQHLQEVSYASFRKTLEPVRDVVTTAALTDGWGHSLPAELRA